MHQADLRHPPGSPGRIERDEAGAIPAPPGAASLLLCALPGMAPHVEAIEGVEASRVTVGCLIRKVDRRAVTLQVKLSIRD